MKNDWLNRTRMLLGEDALDKIKSSNIIVIGIGGVGGGVAEGLIRCGASCLTFVDKDIVEQSNINRQIVALNSTIGQYKTEVMKKRALDINPEAKINAINKFLLPENMEEFELKQYDYIVDAIDNVTAKIELCFWCYNNNIKSISCMGTGNRLNANEFRAADIYETKEDPLAKVMRRELRKKGVARQKVFYSPEKPLLVKCNEGTCKTNKGLVGSVSFVPHSVGLMLAGEVIKDLIKS